jgi:hypothetical protein
MGVVRFDRTVRACDVVVDQFKLGAFGGVTFKAMAAGAPVCTFLNPELMEGLFEQMPPVINCADENEIVVSLGRLLANPQKLATLKTASRNWIKRHHSGGQVVKAQVQEFEKFLRHAEPRVSKHA